VWDFSTEPEFEDRLTWIRAFLTDHVYPLETLSLSREQLLRATAPLKEQVKAAGLWACHLDPELGGQGFGQVKLALMHQVLGRSYLAPPIFGNQAPDSGNAEIIARYGTEAQREQYLAPLLDGMVFSTFALTEPGAGADPTLITTTAVLDGDEWVINGRKWFASNAHYADFVIAACVTNAEDSGRLRTSMIIVPSGTPGMSVTRTVGYLGMDPNHAEIVFDDCRVPRANLLGEQGHAFVIAQKRLGPGRIHHCMRWIGQMERAFDMLCERALSRYAHGSLLAEKQTITNWIADSWAELNAARLLTLQAAWRIDNEGASAARTEIATIKYFGAPLLHNIIDRAIQIHGALGVSDDLPLQFMYRRARAARIYDGPDEVHKQTVARRVLKQYKPSEDLWPSEHIPTRRAAAELQWADLLDDSVAGEHV
jgi:acyl-CoA dehydrogenase